MTVAATKDVMKETEPVQAERVAETALETVAETAEGAPRTSGRCKADC